MRRCGVRDWARPRAKSSCWNFGGIDGHSRPGADRQNDPADDWFRLVRVIGGQRPDGLLRSAAAFQRAAPRMAAAHLRPAVRQVAQRSAAERPVRRRLSERSRPFSDIRVHGFDAEQPTFETIGALTGIPDSPQLHRVNGSPPHRHAQGRWSKPSHSHVGFPGGRIGCLGSFRLPHLFQIIRRPGVPKLSCEFELLLSFCRPLATHE